MDSDRKRTTDLVSYYYVERKLHTISYNEFIKVDDNEIKLEKKIKVEPKVDLVVGRYYGLEESLIKIVGKTPKQYKYSRVNYRLPDDISEKRREYFNLQYSFYEHVKIEDLTNLTESGCVDGVLKLDKYGDWFKGSGYTRKSINYNEIICSDSVL